jgi:hypothetical protein
MHDCRRHLHAAHGAGGGIADPTPRGRQQAPSLACLFARALPLDLPRLLTPGAPGRRMPGCDPGHLPHFCAPSCFFPPAEGATRTRTSRPPAAARRPARAAAGEAALEKAAPAIPRVAQALLAARAAPSWPGAQVRQGNPADLPARVARCPEAAARLQGRLARAGPRRAAVARCREAAGRCRGAAGPRRGAAGRLARAGRCREAAGPRREAAGPRREAAERCREAAGRCREAAGREGRAAIPGCCVRINASIRRPTRGIVGRVGWSAIRAGSALSGSARRIAGGRRMSCAESSASTR